MSTYSKHVQICSVCGTKNSVMVLGSTSTFGASDLDTRPSEKERTDLFYNVQKCTKCGFVAYNLSSETKIKKRFLNSTQYINCDQIAFASEFSKMFYQMYLINLEEGNYQTALWCLVKCAWSADDVSDTKNSIGIRKKCLKLLDTLKNDEYDVKWNIIKLDLLRRSQQFDECIEFIKKLKINRDVMDIIYKISSKEIIDKIIELQLKLCIEKDDKCYNIKGELSKPGNPAWYLKHTSICREAFLFVEKYIS